MASRFCPRCRMSMAIQEASTSQSARCPTCGVRLLQPAPLDTTDPRLKTAIAEVPAKPASDRPASLSQRFPYLGRLLTRLRRWRGGGSSSGPVELQEKMRPLALVGWLYTWFPALGCAAILLLFPVAVVVAFAPSAISFGTVLIVIMTVCLTAVVASVGIAIWYHSRDRWN